MEKKRFNMNVKGIKCDACDYKDMTVPREDYPHWLNKPCPKCGANLLTEADFNTLKRLEKVTNFMNWLFPMKKNEPTSEPVRFYGTANGTGKIEFSSEPTSEDN